mmetsp:Transcript_92912/g.206689  ORF Transcript_92912/g.206689 Transcript_92912/m.206689 type:complete len:202 (+) Transcript_92912:138-743(+)
MQAILGRISSWFLPTCPIGDAHPPTLEGRSYAPPQLAARREASLFFSKASPPVFDGPESSARSRFSCIKACSHTCLLPALRRRSAFSTSAMSMASSASASSSASKCGCFVASPPSSTQGGNPYCCTPTADADLSVCRAFSAVSMPGSPKQLDCSMFSIATSRGGSLQQQGGPVYTKLQTVDIAGAEECGAGNQKDWALLNT